MRAIQPGYDVVSLLDISSQTQSLMRGHSQRGLIMSLISALLVVSVLGITLSALQRVFSRSPRPTTAESIESSTEPVAFQPSTAVSSHVAAGMGYVGR